MRRSGRGDRRAGEACGDANSAKEKHRLSWGLGLRLGLRARRDATGQRRTRGGQDTDRRRTGDGQETDRRRTRDRQETDKKETDKRRTRYGQETDTIRTGDGRETDKERIRAFGWLAYVELSVTLKASGQLEVRFG